MSEALKEDLKQSYKNIPVASVWEILRASLSGRSLSLTRCAPLSLHVCLCRIGPGLCVGNICKDLEPCYIYVTFFPAQGIRYVHFLFPGPSDPPRGGRKVPTAEDTMCLRNRAHRSLSWDSVESSSQGPAFMVTQVTMKTSKGGKQSTVLPGRPCLL